MSLWNFETPSRIWLLIIILIAIFLNIYGIWWGIPDEERIKLVFGDETTVKQLSRVMKETREEIYERTDNNPVAASAPSLARVALYEDKPVEVIVKGGKILLDKARLNSMRSYLLRSYDPDEQMVLTAIAKMKPAKFDFNPHFFTYGGFYIYSVAAALKIASTLGLITLKSDIGYYFLHPGEMGKFFVVGRLVGALMGVLAVYIIYLVGTALYDRKTGLIATLLLSITPPIVIWSHYMKPYIFCLPWLLLSFYMAVKVLESEKLRFYLWGGLFAGLAAGSLYMAGLILSSVSIAHLIKRFPQRKNILSWMGAIFEKGVLMHLLFFAMGFLAVNPYWLPSLDEVRHELEFATSWHTFTPSLSSWVYYFRVSWWIGFGLPLILVIVGSLIYALFKREKSDILIGLFILPAYIYIASTTPRYIHYGIWMFPFLILLAARAIRAGLVIKGIGKYVVAPLLVIVVIYTGLYSFAHIKVCAQKNVRTEAGGWIGANIKPDLSIGFRNVPSPFFAPPVNMFKYKVEWLRGNEQAFLNNPPDYFIGSDYGEIVPSIFRPTIESDYYEIKKFEKIPEVFGIKFNRGKGFPVAWNHPNPVISIYKRRS